MISGGGGGGVLGLIFAVYVPLASQPYYSLFSGHIMDPILVTCEKSNFRKPNLVTFCLCM